MPFRPCPTGCGFYLSPNDRHDRCVQCLGREHAEAAFAEGGCQNCEDMPLGTLRSRAAFFSKKPRRHSTASRSGPSTSGYEAAAMCVEEERQGLNDALPGTSSKTVHPVCPPMESQDDFESSSQYGLDLLFGAPAEEMAGSVASEGEPSEADVTAELTAPAGESQSVADAEMAAALKRAAKEIGVVWVPPPSPEPSRLDDWFLGSGRDSRPRSSPVPFFPKVHEELTKSWKAPLSARSRHAISLSLTTLDGGPARGYTEVPQVERAIAMHLCLQNAASWRGRPRLPSRACKFSSALVAKAYAASGQAASALHAMAILQVYQAKVLKDLHEGVPDPELLHELRSATDYALRATKVTAQALGRAMSTMVVQERHLWLNLAEMRDAEKARFLDAPISQTGLFGETVEEFAQQFSTVKQQTEAIKHILPRRAASAGPAQPTQQPPPAPRRGRPPTRVAQAPQPAGPAARPAPRASTRRKVAPPARPQATKNPRDERWIGTRLSATRQTATTWSIKEQFPSSLGTIYSTSASTRRSDAVSIIRNIRSHNTCAPVCSETTSSFRRSPSRADHLHSSHGSDSLGRAASVVRGFSPPATHCFPSDGTPTLGTPNVTPLRPLAENFSDWLNLPNPSRWLLRTIRLGYAIQFARRPPKFRGVLTTSVQGPNTAVLRAEIAVLLAKGAIETVPSAEMKKGFIVPKKGGGLRPILDLRVLNRALLKLPFKMLTLKHILTCVRVQDWFVAIDLKDAYFHVSILPRHRPFLRFAFEGRAYQYKVLPFGLSLSPRVFTKVAEAALSPLREMGIRILNYLDDWLILAHSWNLVCVHRDMVLNHLAQLGLRVNWEKSKLSPAQRISFLGVELDSVSMSARLSPEHAQSVLRCVATLRCGSAVPLKQVQRLLGHMASSAAVTPLGLMHMRPLQHWLHTRVPRHSALGQTEEVPTYDSGQARVGQVRQHCDCGLHQPPGRMRSKHVRLGCHLLLWVNTDSSLYEPLTFRAKPIDRFGQAQVDLFASPESTHCQLWYGLTEAPLGIDALAHSWPRGRLKYAFPPVSLIAQTLCKVREDKEQILLVAPLLAQQNLVDLEGPPFSGEGHNLAPAPRSLEPPPLVPGRDQEDFRDLSPSVVNTLLQARAPSTRRLYDLKWRIFVNWCSSHGKDPRSCGIKSVLSFLQEGLDRHLSASTLKVHVAAISANHDLVGGRSVGKHDLIIRFQRSPEAEPSSIASHPLLGSCCGSPRSTTRSIQPLQSVEMPLLQTALLTALTSIKKETSKPSPDQVVTLQALSSQEDDPNLTLLCPVRALRIYMERTQPFRRSEQPFCLLRRTAEGESCLQTEDLPLAGKRDPYGLPGQRPTLPSGGKSQWASLPQQPWRMGPH
ncbi:Transposon Ty3-G Gag-Pol polyprotein [Labeo rohita]|uniref:ribonuclease H n=1 Tax=Labeo rohita TaxID=84645 RepID=A0ABQ8LVX3_LABRO|nr:Transposon Ty3-G Gag-Pol polyprotein [Labeo rohita]